MYETPGDVSILQNLLDESHASMSGYMSSILTEEKRLSATALIERLQGMKLLSLATVTAKGEPRVGPVDGLFYRGMFWFGSDPDSVRFRHIRKRPAVSATHLDGEQFAVTVHGVAELVDTSDAGMSGFRELLIETYGESWWHEYGMPAQYARINPARMYTYFVEDTEST